MKKSFFYLALILNLSIIGCSSDKNDSIVPDYKFVPTDVIVKTKGYYTIDKVFEFINGFDHGVEYVYNGIYNSNLPSDSLQYVLNYVNAKAYTHLDTSWYTSGYLQYQTHQITVLPRLYQIKVKDYQEDWLQTIDTLQMKEKTDGEVSGWIIYFHVPEGEEKQWVTKFQTYDFVDWAELNSIMEINTWP